MAWPKREPGEHGVVNVDLGALELGAIVRPSFSPRRNRTGMQLDECALIQSPQQARLDLCRFYQLAYVLELVLKTSVMGQPEPHIYRATRQYLHDLETFRPCHEQLVAWELHLLQCIGQAGEWWPCVATGETPDGISLQAGGAVSGNVRARDFLPVSPSILQKLAMISVGEQPWFETAEHDQVRKVMNHLWRTVLDRPLKSAGCIGPDAFYGPELESQAQMSDSTNRSERR